MRICLDTNVLVSGLISKSGPPARLIRAWLEGRFVLVTSEYQLDELIRVASSDKLRKYITEGELQDLLENIDAVAEVVINAPVVDLSPDPKDNPILAMAIAGDAALIVSGDKPHMLALNEAVGIPIVTARDALECITDG